MTIIDEKVRDEKLQYNINKQQKQKIIGIILQKNMNMNKYEYLTGEEIMPLIKDR